MLGERIRTLRVVRGLTQDELAELVGVDQSHLSKIERGLAPHPSWDLVRRLERALKLNDGDLTRGLDPAAATKAP